MHTLKTGDHIVWNDATTSTKERGTVLSVTPRMSHAEGYMHWDEIVIQWESYRQLGVYHSTRHTHILDKLSHDHT